MEIYLNTFHPFSNIARFAGKWSYLDNIHPFVCSHWLYYRSLLPYRMRCNHFHRLYFADRCIHYSLDHNSNMYHSFHILITDILERIGCHLEHKDTHHSRWLLVHYTIPYIPYGTEHNSFRQPLNKSYLGKIENKCHQIAHVCMRHIDLDRVPNIRR